MAKLSLTKIFGGSSYYISWLLPLMPPRYRERPYLESCGGGFNLGLNKQSSDFEFYNDIDFSIYNIWCWLKKTPSLFIERLSTFDYNRETFEAAKLYCGHYEAAITQSEEANFDYAINNLLLRKLSRGGLMKDYASSNRVRRGDPNGDRGSYLYWRQNTLPLVAQRIKQVQFFNKLAIDIIKEIDGFGVTLFCDPPWLPQTRVVKEAYKHEMTHEDHENLLKLLIKCDSNIVLLGYDNELYNQYLVAPNWNKNIKNVANHSGQGKTKQRRVVTLWRNFI